MLGFGRRMAEMSDITTEFIKAQCRDIVKNIFYRYNDTKILPLYEKKTLMNISELYVGKLGGNSYAGLLLDEMDAWGRLRLRSRRGGI
ncbi:MAG: hypothetical protein LBT88_08370 [Oscillospiraceae bacterium]|jgi:hypothetical protein|nr:hypothetical protein [Oscillospiraceae bacterium]